MKNKTVKSAKAEPQAEQISSTERQPFLQWLETMPDTEDSGEITHPVEVRLHVAEWAKLMAFARRRNHSIESALEAVLSHQLNNWTDRDEACV